MPQVVIPNLFDDSPLAMTHRGWKVVETVESGNGFQLPVCLAEDFLPHYFTDKSTHLTEMFNNVANI